MRPTILTTIAAFFILSCSAQAATPISDFANITTFPNEQYDNVTRYLHEAEALATDPRIYQYFQDQCITQQTVPVLFGMPSGFVKPFSPFDNLLFVGHTGVSSWAYDTGAGLTVIDALNNADEVQAVLLPMLKSFGYQGSDIKSLIITHEHVDHYGGAKYIQDNFNATVYASAACWDALEALPADSNPVPPARGKTLEDAQDITFGNVAFNTVLTPGHTNGTLSLIFPVFTNGTKHMAGLSGGTGTPKGQTNREAKIQSQYKFAGVARTKGVDVLVSNHLVADHAVMNADLIEHRTQESSNPFVIGIEAFVSYMQINAVCSRVIAAREGMDLSI